MVERQSCKLKVLGSIPSGGWKLTTVTASPCTMPASVNMSCEAFWEFKTDSIAQYEWHNKRRTAHDTTTDSACYSVIEPSLLWYGTSLVRECLIAFKHLPPLRHMSFPTLVPSLLACLLPAIAVGCTSPLPCKDFVSNASLLYQIQYLFGYVPYLPSDVLVGCRPPPHAPSI